MVHVTCTNMIGMRLGPSERVGECRDVNMCKSRSPATYAAPDNDHPYGRRSRWHSAIGSLPPPTSCRLASTLRTMSFVVRTRLARRAFQTRAWRAYATVADVSSSIPWVSQTCNQSGI